jgi:hypothetical protein
MLRYRRYALAALLLLATAGCGGSSSTATKAVSSATPASGSARPSSSAPSSGNPVTSKPLPSKPLPSKPSSKPVSSPVKPARTTPAPGTIALPATLCSATDVAQNAADAYLGALSAGDAKQAAACVLPGAVPSAVTRSLLATTKATAVYLPRDGVDGPKVFGYSGNGKTVDVTVTKQPDGRFLVTKVVIRPA